MTNDPQKDIRYSGQIAVFKEIIEQHQLTKNLKRILVLGCGNGLEAAAMATMLNIDVYGVDVNQDFHPYGLQHAHLQNYNGLTLPFENDFFDAVYSFHVLEHVDDVSYTVWELRRVTREDGFVYIGVPNKSRWIGYLGMNDKSLYRKINQNIKDWMKRLLGQWDNALGAHAGFYEKELCDLLGRYFARTESVSDFYYAMKWKKYDKMLKLFKRYSLEKIVLPSIYILAR